MARVHQAQHALDEVREAQERCCGVLHRLYPIGSEIVWERGGHKQYGTVQGNSSYGSGDRFRVRNDATGKVYWITFYDVQRAARHAALSTGQHRHE